MKIFIASDHAGYELKKHVADYLSVKEIIDCGPFDDKDVDYPAYAHMVARHVLKNTNSRGILICGTGIGMSMMANRFPHIRAALCRDIEDAEMSRKHNDSNVLCLAARKGITETETLRIIDTWIQTSHEDESRHSRRVYLLDQLHIPL